MSAPAPRSPYAQRFALLLAALGGLALGAVAVAAILVAGGKQGPDTGWAEWRPSGTALANAQEIADHVAPSYRLPSGRQLAIVTGGELEFAELPAHLAVRTARGDTVVQGDSVLFTLCGGGINCSIAEGRPSRERLLLLRREALDLALRAFHDLDGVDNVVALLPPNRDAVLDAIASARLADRDGDAAAETSVPRMGVALLFRREQLETALEEPLAATLPPETPDVSTIAAAPEAQLVGLITEQTYRPSLVEGQDASIFLLLSELT